MEDGGDSKTKSVGGAESLRTVLRPDQVPSYVWWTSCHSYSYVHPTFFSVSVSRVSPLLIPPLLEVGDTQTAWLFSSERLKVKGTPLKSQGLYLETILY